MKTLLAFLFFFSSFQAFAKTSLDEQMQDATDWPSFEKVAEQARKDDVTIGTSYLVSGALVALGGIAGANTAADDTSRFVFTLSQSLGVAGMGYGFAKLSFGNEYNSFYSALSSTRLTPDQRNELVRVFMEKEREKRAAVRRINIITHVLLGALNFYAASQEHDTQAKTFLQFFGGANLALAAAYTF